MKDKLDMNTPFNLSTNNDIVGGNSGSPLINAKGEIVGLMFDGNIHSISGSYWFDTEKNRAVAVHPAIIREALSKVYGADALAGGIGRVVRPGISRRFPAPTCAAWQSRISPAHSAIAGDALRSDTRISSRPATRPSPR